MFESGSVSEVGTTAVAAVPAPSCGPGEGVVRGWREALTVFAVQVAGDVGVPGQVGGADEAAGGAAAAVGLIAELESLRDACAGAQAALAVRVDRCRREQEAVAGVPARRRGQGVAAEIALARRVGASAGSRLLGLGKVLVGEMPHTFARLAGGELSEWRAMLLARETACLDLEDRVGVDAQLCADPRTLAGKGDRAVVAAAKQAAYRRDAFSVVRRSELAEADRRVWLRPAPDQMAYLTALLPLTQAVACYASLKDAADTARTAGDPARTTGDPARTTGDPAAAAARAHPAGHGDPVGSTGTCVVATAGMAAGSAPSSGLAGGGAPGAGAAAGAVGRPAGPADVNPAPVVAPRGHGQVMADTLVTRLTGLADPAAVPVRVNLLMTDTTLFGGDNEPAVLPGYGPVPAGWARKQAGRDDAPAWVRRLYVAPRTGDLLAMDARSRKVPTALAEFIGLRDQGGCRMPWCDAPIRHHDHVVPAATGGPTSAENLQGLCEAHNYAKEAPGWVMTPETPLASVRQRSSGPRQRVMITTPAGTRYRTRPPRPPGAPSPPGAASPPGSPRAPHAPGDTAGPAP